MQFMQGSFQRRDAMPDSDVTFGKARFRVKRTGNIDERKHAGGATLHVALRSIYSAAPIQKTGVSCNLQFVFES